MSDMESIIGINGDEISPYMAVMDNSKIDIAARQIIIDKYIAVFAVEDDYIYAADDAKTYTIIKINKSDLSVVATSPVQSGRLQDFIIVGAYIYFVNHAAKTIVKLNKSNLSVVATSPAQSVSPESFVADGSYCYFYNSTSKTIIKLNQTNWSVVATSSVVGGVYYPLIDNNYIYFSDTTAKTMVKLNKSNLSVAATSPVMTGYPQRSVIVDDYIYFSNTSRGAIGKLNKSDLSVAATSIELMPSGSGGKYFYNPVIVGNYVYCINTDRVVFKMDKSDLSVVGISSPQSTASVMSAFTVDMDYIYFIIDTSFIIMDCSTLEVVKTIVLLNNASPSIALDNDSKFAFCASRMNGSVSSMITKISKKTSLYQIKGYRNLAEEIA